MSNKNSSNQSPSNGGGHGFGMGLLVGGMAGVAAYFMFGTDQGDKLRKKLVEEFEYGKIKIPQDIARILEEADFHASQINAPDSNESSSLISKLASTMKREQEKVSAESSRARHEVIKKSKNVFTKSGRKL